MFEISEEALGKAKQFLEGREGPQTVRILLNEGGWKGPYLVMALDEQKETDEVFKFEGVKFLVEKALFERVKPINIGYTHSTLGAGYTIESQLLKGMKDVSVECHDIYNSCQNLPG